MDNDASYEIREYNDKDYDGVLKVIESFSQEHRRLAEREFLPMVRMHKSRFFVCTQGNFIAGVLGYRKDKMANGIYWAEWGYVHTSHRNRGIATQLWDVIETDLRQSGCRKLYIDVGNESDHADAIRIYKKRGYIQEGFCPDFWKEGEDFLIFAKRLN